MEDAFTICIEKLEEQVKPTTNDIRYREYLEYINAFLQHFGEERAYLVGSTGDGTKLTEPTDHGDADFLLVTGPMKIPVKCIKFRPESSTYFWIKRKGIPHEIGQGFFDNGYLKSGILHELHPKLFSIARGIYTILSSNIDRVRGANKDKTSLGIRSKVGLALTTYKGIEILGNLDQYRHNVTKASTQGGFVTLPKLESKEDSIIFDRFIELLKLAKQPGKRDEFRGEITFFIDLLGEALSKGRANTELIHTQQDLGACSAPAFELIYTRQNGGACSAPKKPRNSDYHQHDRNKVEDGKEGTLSNGPANTELIHTQQNIGASSAPAFELIYTRQNEGACSAPKKPRNSDYHQHDRNKAEDGNEGITLQFNITSNIDFVPAIKIDGELECMNRWKNRVEKLGWAKAKIDDIYGTDVFIITREAIISPNPTLDFCLAFSLQEQKLVKGFSKCQRIVYLILKTLRKGCFDSKFKQHNTPLKLRTYHMKTVALWIFENGYYGNALEMLEDDIDPPLLSNIINATMDALTYLKTAVNSRLLKHYFTEDNLLANFDKSDFEIISEVCDAIQRSTAETLAQSLERNEKTTDKINLSRDEIGILLKLQIDGGRQNNVDRVREALADILRGINSAKKDCQDNEKKDCQENESALKLALLDVSRLALQNHSSNMSATKDQDTAQGKALSLGKRFKAVQTSFRKLTDHSQDYINHAEMLLNSIPKLNQEVEQISGIELLLSVLSNGAGDIDGLLKLIEDFLTVPNELKDNIATKLKEIFELIFS